MVKKSDPDFDSKRLCFKIVSTYPGLAAAKILESKGVAALGTALFCMEQASLAGHMGCTYISPYFNELRVHFDKEYVDILFLSFFFNLLLPNVLIFPLSFQDQHKATSLCRDAAAYYSAHSQKTKVKAASFVSADEVMHHAGVDYITVFPPVIKELSETPVANMPVEEVGKYMSSSPDETAWKGYEEAAAGGREVWEEKFNGSGGGENARKLREAIETFSGEQKKLEELVRKVAG